MCTLFSVHMWLSTALPAGMPCRQASEALALWFGYKAAEVNNFPAAEQRQLEKDVLERLHIVLLRLSGNMAPTIRDAQGNMGQVTRSSSGALLSITPPPNMGLEPGQTYMQDWKELLSDCWPHCPDRASGLGLCESPLPPLFPVTVLVVVAAECCVQFTQSP